MIQAKCSLNSINRVMVTISMIVLTFALLFIVSYFIYIKWYKIDESFTNTSTSQSVELGKPISVYEQEGQLLGESSCTFPKIKYPEEVVLRDCQVYFTEDTATCDTDKAKDPNNTCKYVFHGWKEFDTAIDEQGNTINYAKKIYTPMKTRDIINGPLVNKCFKQFRSNAFAEKYEYQNNDLINHDCKGISGDIENDTNQFNDIKYTSFNFFNTSAPSTNYNNVINSICSVKYKTFDQLRNKSFFKFELNSANNILSIKKYKFNDEQNNLVQDQSFNADQFTSSSIYGLEYDADNNFKVFSVTNYPSKPVTIYRFQYNYLCSDKQVTSFNTIPSNINIVSILEFGSVTTRNISIDISNAPNINWNSFKNSSTSAEREDFKPAIIKALQDKVDERKQIIDNRNATTITTLNNVIDTTSTSLAGIYKTINTFNATFDNIIDITSNPDPNKNIMNVTRGAIVNKKELSFSGSDVYNETIIKRDKFRKGFTFYKLNYYFWDSVSGIEEKIKAYNANPSAAAGDAQRVIYKNAGILNTNGLTQSTGALQQTPNVDNITDRSNPNIQAMYTMVWKGYFYAHYSGRYRFKMWSDDAGYIYLNNAFQMTVNNEGLHGLQLAESNFTYLQRGSLTKIFIIFGENWGGDDFYFEWERTDSDMNVAGLRTAMYDNECYWWDDCDASCGNCGSSDIMCLTMDVAPKQIDNEHYYYELTDENMMYEMTLPNAAECEVLIVGGGGSGGVRHGGGGGAGALIYKGPNEKENLVAGTYTLKVGAGGMNMPGKGVNNHHTVWHINGQNGEDSYIQINGNDLFRAKGGGAGAGWQNRGFAGGSSGGCVGGWNGGSANALSTNVGGKNRNGGIITGLVAGHKGGTGVNYQSGWWWNGAGGGGAGGPGADCVNGVSGNGGAAVAINITGTMRAFAGGGGGGGRPDNSYDALGGSVAINNASVYVGGSGSRANTTAGSGVANTGSGGGGSGYGGEGHRGNGISGAGGSGIIILKFRKSASIANTMFQNTSFYSNTTNLVGWYRFGNAQNNPITMMQDYSGNNNTMQNNGATFDENTFIKENGSASFGVNKYMTIPSSIDIYNISNINGIAFSLWFKLSPSSGNWARIMDFADGNDGSNPSNWVVIAKYGSTRQLIFEIGTSGRRINYVTDATSGVYIDDRWHHVVWSISQDYNWKIYVDGRLIYNNTQVTQGNRIPNVTFTRRSIGRSAFSSDGWLEGNIDDFRIYNKVLNHIEVNTLYMHENISNNNTSLYTLTTSTPNYTLTTTYSTTLVPNNLFVYSLHAYLYLQQGHYKFYAFLNIDANITYTSEFCILDQNNRACSVSYIKSVVVSGTNKYNTYTPKKHIHITSGGFYKIQFKATGFNNTASAINAQLNIFADYIYRLDDASTTQLSSLSTSVSTATSAQVNNIYNIAQVNTISSLRSSTKNTINDNRVSNNPVNNNTLNFTQFLYYGFNYDTFTRKDIYNTIHNIIPNTQANVSVFKNYIDAPPRDYFGRITNENTLSTKENELRTLQQGIEIQKGESTATLAGYTIDPTIAQVTNVMNTFKNINYQSIMPVTSRPTLKTGQSIYSILTPALSEMQQSAAITTEPYARSMLTADGSIPSNAPKSLYVEEFV